MGSIYNSLLLEQLFFPSLNFSLSFFYFPFPSFVPYFFSIFDVFPIFSLSFFYLWKSIFIFSFYFKEPESSGENLFRGCLWYFFIINDLCISLLHTQYTFLYIFFITLFKFYKNVCKEMCTNHDLFFLLIILI